MKKEIQPEFLWHIDQVVLAFQATIITTQDAQGHVNAAPFGFVYPFSTGSGPPQMLVGSNVHWHTAQNILATQEFVINYAPHSLFEKVAITGLFYDQGVNELEKAGLTALPALQVAPPRIAECYQHIECRLNHIIRPNEIQLNFIGDIVAISMNEELLGRDKQAKVKVADPLIFAGMDIMTSRGTYGRIADMTDYAPSKTDT